jgi:hypothetical protein
MGRFTKDDLVLDFQGLKTENMSSTIPYLNKLNMDAKSLITKLYVPANTKTLSHFNETENYDMYKLFEKAPYVNNNDNNFSETSPFISSDIYKSLLASKQKGGAHGKDDDDSDDDDSSTSSSSSNSTDDKKKKNKKKHAKDNKHKKDKKHRKTPTESDDSAATTPDDDEEDEDDEEKEESEEEMFMGRGYGSSESIGSYVSSSAHSDGAEILTVSSKYGRNNQNKHKNNNKNRNGHRNRNSNRNKLSESIDSIDTSDIRLVSID